MSETNPPQAQGVSELVERLLLMADQGDFGRKPDPSDIRRRAAATLQRYAAALEETTTLLARYREETPAGHSPHMICHLADAAIERARTALSKDTTNG